MNKKIIVFLLFTLLFSFPLLAQNKAKEVMEKVAAQSEIHKTQESKVYMKISDSKGRKRERYFNYTKKIMNPKETRSLVKFYKPTNIKNTALLSYAKKDDDTIQWLYLPAFKSVKQLSTEEKNKSFMGSDFSVADIAGRQVNQDRHEMIKEDDKFFYIRSIPKDKNDVYSKLEIVVSKSIYVPLKIDFFDKRGKLLKTLTNSKVKKVKGMYVITKSKMENVQTKGKTATENSDIEVGISVSDSKVGLQGLKK